MIKVRQVVLEPMRQMLTIWIRTGRCCPSNAGIGWWFAWGEFGSFSPCTNTGPQMPDCTSCSSIPSSQVTGCPWLLHVYEVCNFIVNVNTSLCRWILGRINTQSLCGNQVIVCCLLLLLENFYLHLLSMSFKLCTIKQSLRSRFCIYPLWIKLRLESNTKTEISRLCFDTGMRWCRLRFSSIAGIRYLPVSFPVRIFSRFSGFFCMGTNFIRSFHNLGAVSEEYL